jgi:hypothetical protein
MLLPQTWNRLKPNLTLTAQLFNFEIHFDRKHKNELLLKQYYAQFIRSIRLN